MRAPTKETKVKWKRRIMSGAVAILAAVALAGVLAGCGDSTSPTESSEQPSPAASPPGADLSGFKAYVKDANAVLAQVGATAGALPDAVQGMSTTPDDTWTASAAELQDISAQLGEEAASLDALQPPPVLQPVQDAAVNGIEDAQRAVDELATALEKGVQNAETATSAVQSTVDDVRAQLDDLSQALSGAVLGVTGPPSSSPSP